MIEKWLPIVSYEGIYEVSDLGRVRRIAAGSHTHRGRLVKATAYGKQKQRLRLSLSVRNIRKSYPLHRIVAEAFLGPKPQGMTINHRDLNVFNNQASNLEYVSQLANYWHARKAGRMGVTIPQETVEAIRNNRHLPQIELQKMFGLGSASISRIINNKTRILPEPEDYRHV